MQLNTNLNTNFKLELEELAINSKYEEAEQIMNNQLKRHYEELDGSVRYMWKHAKGYLPIE